MAGSRQAPSAASRVTPSAVGQPHRDAKADNPHTLPDDPAHHRAAAAPERNPDADLPEVLLDVVQSSRREMPITESRSATQREAPHDHRQ